MRVRDSSTSSPLSSGIAPPQSPVLPPWGTTPTPAAEHSLTTAATSSVEAGDTMIKVCPLIRPRRSERYGSSRSGFEIHPFGPTISLSASISISFPRILPGMQMSPSQYCCHRRPGRRFFLAARSAAVQATQLWSQRTQAPPRISFFQTANPLRGVAAGHRFSPACLHIADTIRTKTASQKAHPDYPQSSRLFRSLSARQRRSFGASNPLRQVRHR